MAGPVTTSRRDAILEAVANVFLRYGFKKTSMDNLAQAVGISRQGLYLHFETKEAAFRAAVLWLVAQSRAKHEAALQRDDLPVQERLLGAFETLHGTASATPLTEHLDELLLAAAAIVGPHVAELETRFVADVAGILAASGIAARWKAAGLSAHDLAEHLYATSSGLKHSAKSKTSYRRRMRVALTIATGRPGP